MKKSLAIVPSVLLSSLLLAYLPQAGAQQSTTAPAAKPAAEQPAAQSPQSAVDAASAALAAATADAPKAAQMVGGLPAVPLTEDLMFKLLSAEIAFQRGEWEVAYVTTMMVAQQTRDPRIAKRAAEMALAAKATGEALSAVRLWVQLEPQSEEAAQYLLGLVVLSDELDVAEGMFVQRLEAAEPAARGLLLLQVQRMLLRAKDKPAAFALLERLAAPYADLAESSVALAQGAAASGDAGRAVREAQRALAKNPDLELGILTLAQVMPDREEAAKALQAFLVAHPRSREVRLAHARLQVEQKEYAKARAEFEVLLKQRPDDISSMYALGVLASQAGDYATSEKQLGAYVQALADKNSEERDPTPALQLLAQMAEEQKNYERADKWLAQVARGPSYINAQVRRAQLQARQGKLDAGIAQLRAVRAENDNEQVQLIAGEAALLREGSRVLEALALMQAGLQRFPNNADLLYDLSMMAEKAGQFPLMESTLRRLIEVAPENQHAYNALGYSLADRNERLQEALQLIEKALSLAPDDAFIIDSYGWVLFRLGRLKEAEDALRRAYGMRSDAEIAVHLGEVLWMQERKDEAQQLWREARKRDPQNDTLKSTLARLNAKL